MQRKTLFCSEEKHAALKKAAEKSGRKLYAIIDEMIAKYLKEVNDADNSN